MRPIDQVSEKAQGGAYAFSIAIHKGYTFKSVPLNNIASVKLRLYMAVGKLVLLLVQKMTEPLPKTHLTVVRCTGLHGVRGQRLAADAGHVYQTNLCFSKNLGLSRRRSCFWSENLDMKRAQRLGWATPCKIGWGQIPINIS